MIAAHVDTAWLSVSFLVPGGFSPQQVGTRGPTSPPLHGFSVVSVVIARVVIFAYWVRLTGRTVGAAGIRAAEGAGPSYPQEGSSLSSVSVDGLLDLADNRVSQGGGQSGGRRAVVFSSPRCWRPHPLEAHSAACGRVEQTMLDSVVLMVYQWKDVQPGTLSWVFPSAAAAALAARAMTNAQGWAVLPGPSARANMDAPLDLAKVRAEGGVLLEETG